MWQAGSSFSFLDDDDGEKQGRGFPSQQGGMGGFQQMNQTGSTGNAGRSQPMGFDRSLLKPEAGDDLNDETFGSKSNFSAGNGNDFDSSMKALAANSLALESSKWRSDSSAPQHSSSSSSFSQTSPPALNFQPVLVYDNPPARKPNIPSPVGVHGLDAGASAFASSPSNASEAVNSAAASKVQPAEGGKRKPDYSAAFAPSSASNLFFTPFGSSGLGSKPMGKPSHPFGKINQSRSAPLPLPSTSLPSFISPAQAPAMSSANAGDGPTGGGLGGWTGMAATAALKQPSPTVPPVSAISRVEAYVKKWIEPRDSQVLLPLLTLHSITTLDDLCQLKKDDLREMGIEAVGTRNRILSQLAILSQAMEQKKRMPVPQANAEPAAMQQPMQQPPLGLANSLSAPLPRKAPLSVGPPQQQQQPVGQPPMVPVDPSVRQRQLLQVQLLQAQQQQLMQLQQFRAQQALAVAQAQQQEQEQQQQKQLEMEREKAAAHQRELEASREQAAMKRKQQMELQAARMKEAKEAELMRKRKQQQDQARLKREAEVKRQQAAEAEVIRKQEEAIRKKEEAARKKQEEAARKKAQVEEEKQRVREEQARKREEAENRKIAEAEAQKRRQERAAKKRAAKEERQRLEKERLERQKKLEEQEKERRRLEKEEKRRRRAAEEQERRERQAAEKAIKEKRKEAERFEREQAEKEKAKKKAETQTQDMKSGKVDSEENSNGGAKPTKNKKQRSDAQGVEARLRHTKMSSGNEHVQIDMLTGQVALNGGAGAAAEAGAELAEPKQRKPVEWVYKVDAPLLGPCKLPSALGGAGGCEGRARVSDKMLRNLRGSRATSTAPEHQFDYALLSACDGRGTYSLLGLFSRALVTSEVAYDVAWLVAKAGGALSDGGAISITCSAASVLDAALKRGALARLSLGEARDLLVLPAEARTGEAAMGSLSGGAKLGLHMFKNFPEDKGSSGGSGGALGGVVMPLAPGPSTPFHAYYDDYLRLLLHNKAFEPWRLSPEQLEEMGATSPPARAVTHATLAWARTEARRLDSPRLRLRWASLLGHASLWSLLTGDERLAAALKAAQVGCHASLADNAFILALLVASAVALPVEVSLSPLAGADEAAAVCLGLPPSFLGLGLKYPKGSLFGTSAADAKTQSLKKCKAWTLAPQEAGKGKKALPGGARSGGGCSICGSERFNSCCNQDGSPNFGCAALRGRLRLLSFMRVHSPLAQLPGLDTREGAEDGVQARRLLQPALDTQMRRVCRVASHQALMHALRAVEYAALPTQPQLEELHGALAAFSTGLLLAQCAHWAATSCRLRSEASSPAQHAQHVTQQPSALVPARVLLRVRALVGGAVPGVDGPPHAEEGGEAGEQEQSAPPGASEGGSVQAAALQGGWERAVKLVAQALCSLLDECERLAVARPGGFLHECAVQLLLELERREYLSSECAAFVPKPSSEPGREHLLLTGGLLDGRMLEAPELEHRQQEQLAEQLLGERLKPFKRSLVRRLHVCHLNSSSSAAPESEAAEDGSVLSVLAEDQLKVPQLLNGLGHFAEWPSVAVSLLLQRHTPFLPYQSTAMALADASPTSALAANLSVPAQLHSWNKLHRNARQQALSMPIFTFLRILAKTLQHVAKEFKKGRCDFGCDSGPSLTSLPALPTLSRLLAYKAHNVDGSPPPPPPLSRLPAQLSAVAGKLAPLIARLLNVAASRASENKPAAPPQGAVGALALLAAYTLAELGAVSRGENEQVVNAAANWLFEVSPPRHSPGDSAETGEEDLQNWVVAGSPAVLDSPVVFSTFFLSSFHSSSTLPTSEQQVELEASAEACACSFAACHLPPPDSESMCRHKRLSAATKTAAEAAVDAVFGETYELTARLKEQAKPCKSASPCKRGGHRGACLAQCGCTVSGCCCRETLSNAAAEHVLEGDAFCSAWATRGVGFRGSPPACAAMAVGTELNVLLALLRDAFSPESLEASSEPEQTSEPEAMDLHGHFHFHVPNKQPTAKSVPHCSLCESSEAGSNRQDKDSSTSQEDGGCKGCAAVHGALQHAARACKAWYYDSMCRSLRLADAERLHLLQLKDRDECDNQSCMSEPPKHLKTCTKCKTRVYCCRECQLADWKNHKLECAIYAFHGSS